MRPLDTHSMPDPAPPAPLSAAARLRIALARLQWQVGTPGMIGLLLGLMSAAIGLDAWRGQGQAVEFLPPTATPPAVTRAPPVPAPPRVPGADEVPRLLARIERTAVAEGLGWPQADYRIGEAAGTPLASLEVRCILKGPYPAVRRFVAALLLDNPSLSFKEFSISRSSTDASDVDARLGIVIWIAAPSPGARS